jgi:hypothetical protein
VRPDARAGGIAARYAVLVGAVLLAAVPLYVFVELPWRAVVARLASGLVLGIALLELRSALAQRLDGHDSALDEARVRPTPGPDVHQRFVALRGDVRAALRSRRHFEHGLWPQLTALSRRPLLPPPLRRGRGPSLASLREVIAIIETER